MFDTDWLWPEQVAERAGVTTRTINWYTSQTRRRMRAGTATGADLPPPGRHRMRNVPATGGGLRRVRSPQWHKDVIAGWLPQRRGPGGKPPAGDGAEVAS